MLCVDCLALPDDASDHRRFSRRAGSAGGSRQSIKGGRRQSTTPGRRHRRRLHTYKPSDWCFSCGDVNDLDDAAS
jgi:hypothetical protein